MVELTEVPAHEGSPHMILVAGNGSRDEPTPEITLAQRVLMALRVQAIANAAKAALKWNMGSLKSVAPAAIAPAPVGDLDSELGRLAPGGNIYAAAINAAIADKAEKQRAADTVVAIIPSAPITTKPGESLLDAAKRILKEQGRT